MTPRQLQSLVLSPGLSMLPSTMDTHSARVMLTAIALQESALRHRAQVPVPYARGWWQFERGGGVRGVLNHPATSDMAIQTCRTLGYDTDQDTVWKALEHNDLLACVFARLLLWTLPYALPEHQDQGWEQYLEAWRPGKPHPEKWGECWSAATEAVTK